MSSFVDDVSDFRLSPRGVAGRKVANSGYDINPGRMKESTSRNIAGRRTFPVDEVTKQIYASYDAKHQNSNYRCCRGCKRYKVLVGIAISMLLYIVLYLYGELDQFADHPCTSVEVLDVVHSTVNMASISKKHSTDIVFQNISKKSNRDDEAIQHHFKHHTLVLGTAIHVDRKTFAIFCRSLRKFNPVTEIVVIVQFPADQYTYNEAILSNVSLVDADFSTFDKDYLSSYHISSKRWPLYDKYLQSRSQLELVWIVDVSDIMFQDDPFTLFEEYDDRSLFLFRPVRGISIGGDVRLATIFKKCFGETRLQAVRSKHVVTPRAIAGGLVAIKTFASHMSSILLSEQVQFPSSKEYLFTDFPTCENYGADEAVENAVVHLGVMSSNISVRINALGKDKATFIVDMTAPMIRTTVSQVFDSSDHLVPIVHNYHHHPVLVEYVIQSYLPWVNSKNHKDEWDSEPSCSNYNFIENKDFFHKSCELMEIYALTPASCCTACNNAKMVGERPRQHSCNAFTFTKRKCFLKYCDQRELDLVHHPKVLSGETNSFHSLIYGGWSAYKIPTTMEH